MASSQQPRGEGNKAKGSSVSELTTSMNTVSISDQSGGNTSNPVSGGGQFSGGQSSVAVDWAPNSQAVNDLIREASDYVLLRQGSGSTPRQREDAA